MYSHFPQNAELLFTMSIMLHSEALAQMFTWLAFFTSVLWIRSLQGRFSEDAGRLATLLICTHTAVLLLSSTTYIESIVMLWITAAVISYLRWLETPPDSKPSYFWICAAGIFCGMGMGTKYYAGICAGTLAVLFTATIAGKQRTHKKHVFYQILLFCAIILLLYLPWGIKNILETGNPVFPFFYGIFGINGSGLISEQPEKYFRILSEYGHKGGFFKSLLGFPQIMANDPGKYGGGMDVLGSLGWEVLFASFPFMLLAAWKNRIARYAGLYLFIHWCAWFATGKILRFLTVIVPLASLLAAEGIVSVRGHVSANGRKLITAGLIFFTATRLILFAYVQHTFENPKVLLGLESHDEFLARKLLYYPCANAANKMTPADSRILFVGEQRTYYTRRISIPTSIFNENNFAMLANACETRDTLRRSMLSEGITHIIIVPAEAARLKGYGTMNVTSHGDRIWSEFISSGTTLLYAGRECYLYGINSNE